MRWRLADIPLCYSYFFKISLRKLEGFNLDTAGELIVKTTFICISSGKFKFHLKSDENFYVPAWKFTSNLLHMQSAKISLILSDCGSLHLRKMKLFVNKQLKHREACIVQ